MNSVLTPAKTIASYMPAAHHYDECYAADGSVRPTWQPIIDSLSSLGPDGMRQRVADARRLVEESGANFRTAADIYQKTRPWDLAVAPLVIGKPEWAGLETGLKQRVRVLEAVLADLLGPQRLLANRILPAELLSANPGYERAYTELPELKQRLHLTATDLARDNDGTWWVTGDRTRAPSGLGYALENRVITGRVLPRMIRKNNVIRLASFFGTLQKHLRSLAKTSRDNPRIVILTPSELNYRYVEDAYLARYLGYTLVQGRDLAVRGNRLNVKTLGGPVPIDVLLRHVSDRKCDPLELNPMSTEGATGMLQTIRSGKVAVANALGNVLVQMPALLPFLPAASKFLIGEDLILPSIATYWCGGKKECDHVLSHLDDLILKPAFFVSSKPPIDPSRMSADGKGSTEGRNQSKPLSLRRTATTAAQHNACLARR